MNFRIFYYVETPLQIKIIVSHPYMTNTDYKIEKYGYSPKNTLYGADDT